MQALLPLGNDIVDLRLPDNRASASNALYVERIIATQEWDSPAFVAGNERVFWAYWAAKEAAYKSLVKTEPDLLFAHRRFRVFPDATDALPSNSGSASGVVLHGNWRVPVHWQWNMDWVHCLTGSDSNQQFYRIAALKDYISSAPFKAAHKATDRLSDASIVARLLAQSLLHEFGIDDAHIVRTRSGRRYGPPRIEQNGRPITDMDISLSHDGRYSAAAICRLV